MTIHSLTLSYAANTQLACIYKTTRFRVIRHSTTDSVSLFVYATRVIESMILDPQGLIHATETGLIPALTSITQMIPPYGDELLQGIPPA